MRAAMKHLRKLAIATLVLALHTGLLTLMNPRSPPAVKPGANPTTVALPTTVVVLLSSLPDKPVPHSEPTQTSADKPARATGAPGPLVAKTPLRLDTNTAAAVALPALPAASTPASDNPTHPSALNISLKSLQSAAHETDRNSLWRLALQSGKIDELKTLKADPIAIAAAEASEPPCPPAIQLRESVGPAGYRLTPDRSGDCAYERSVRVRAKALAR